MKICSENEIKVSVLQEIENKIDKYLRKHGSETIVEVKVTVQFQRLETIVAGVGVQNRKHEDVEKEHEKQA
jgi:hypothetical protein